MCNLGIGACNCQQQNYVKSITPKTIVAPPQENDNIFGNNLPFDVTDGGICPPPTESHLPPWVVICDGPETGGIGGNIGKNDELPPWVCQEVPMVYDFESGEYIPASEAGSKHGPKPLFSTVA